MKLSDFKLERFFAKYEFYAKYLLCSSDCESMNVGELLGLEEGSEEELKKVWLGYTETQGHPKLREEIAKLYNNVSAENVIVFSGAQEGIFIFSNVILSEGDHIIVQFPAYQSLYSVAEDMGCEVTKWRMDSDNNWELDLEFLRKNIKKNTKAIVINNPHNPTGYLMSKDKFEALVKIAKENNLFLFSDEVYRGLEYKQEDRLPAVCEVYDKGISLGVMSKTFGLAGLRIGWIVAKDGDLLKKIASFKDFTTIDNSAPSEFLATLALRHKEEIIKRNLEIIKGNLKLVDDFLIKHGDLFEWTRPRAGPIGLVKMNFDKNSEDFCIDVVEKKSLMLLPSTVYDIGDKHFRVGMGRKNTPEALKKFEEYIQDNL